MHNIWGLIGSFVFVFLVIGLSTLLQKMHLLKDEGARKFIHIGVSNWWFFVIFLFDNLWYAIIPPIIFIVLNYISYRTNLIKSMERGGKGNLGTVYFPISLLLLVMASFTFSNAVVGGIGILILGYGDGLAAVIGKRYGKHTFSNGKSFAGSLTMFLVSLIVTILMTHFSYDTLVLWQILLISISTALVATLIELWTPKGLDNLSVPLVAAFIFGLLVSIV